MKGTEKDTRKEQDVVLEELFRHAEARERPPADTEASIRASLHGQWKDMARRRRRTRGIALAAAASVVMVVILAGILFREPTELQPGLDTASVELLRGRVSLLADDAGPGVELAVGRAVQTGQAVSTSHGAGLALRWHNGIGLRLDQNSRLIFISQDRIELTAGRVYIDTSEADGSSHALELKTPAGPVRHLGTRFMVAVFLGTTSVSVRDGQVRVGTGSALASAGEKLRVSASGELRKETIAVYGDDWQWTENLAEPISPDGLTVSELLIWIGHETGRSVEYASQQVKRLAGETRLHGDFGLEPMQALELIVQSTDLTAIVLEGAIVIDMEPLP